MKLNFKYDAYLNYDAYLENLRYLSETYSDIFKLESIAKTKQNKDIWAITITQDLSQAQNKPAVYIDANIHAGEVTGMMSALYTMDYLCSTYENDVSTQDILSQYTFYLIPMVSPDGIDAYLNENEKLRSTNQMYPYETRQDGLHPKDMDGDGAIRMMRIKSEYGSWKEDKKDARIMTKRLPHEVRGDFYHIYPEGEIVNYDGNQVYVAPNKWGLDFNRNFPFAWFSETRQKGAGKYPLSNVETKALVDFVLGKPNIAFVNALHTTGGVFIYPPGTYSEKDAHAQDMKLFKDMGKIALEKTGYPTDNVFDGFLSDTVNYSSGAFDDWCYETQGIPAFTIELWDLFSRVGIKYEDVKEVYKDETKGEEAYRKVVKWIDDNLDKKTILKWTKIQHPQLGEVEIGGFDFRFVMQNPPKNFLQQEVEKVSDYLITSAYALPKLKLEKVKVEKIENQLYKVSVFVANTGYLSTHLSQKRLDEKKNQSIKIQIDLKDIEGKDSKEIEFLQGYGFVKSSYGYDGISTFEKPQQIQSVSFMVKTNTQKTLSLKVSHPIAGILETKVALD